MMNLSASSFIAILGAYIVGSLPIGFWIARWAGIQDIRRHGSGNIGATNVARLLGLHYFFVVFTFDAFKAFFYIRLCQNLEIAPFTIMLCAYALLFGNAYSFLLQGTGGKGMATFVGIMLALNSGLCFALVLTWIITVSYFRVIGIASVITAFMVPLYALLFMDFYGFLFLVTIALWIAHRHKDNVRVYYTGRW